MSHSSNTRKKQIKRCKKDEKYEFVLNGKSVKYVGNPTGYKLFEVDLATNKESI